MSPSSSNNDWTASFFQQADMGRRYKNAETITGAFARTLIQEAGLLEEPPSSSSSPDGRLTILDNAGGIGAVTAALHDMLPQSSIEKMELTCGDFSEPMLKAAEERIGEKGWANTKTKIVDAQQMDLPSETFTHVLTNFAIMGLQQPVKALNECLRILHPGGTCAFTTWAHTAWVADLRSAISTLPSPPPFPSDLTLYRSWGDGGDWHIPSWIHTHLSTTTAYNNQFTDIRIETVEKDLEMESPAVFVDTFSVMLPVMLKRFWSEEERRERGGEVLPALERWMEGKYGKGQKVRMRWVANVVVARKRGGGGD
ncbi:MAG: hypothetical protein Q9220_003343 [cf. Caloplaca sp. 1 TL-2023]